ncbi:hypothetical protein [Kineosporia succinea]|uniref:Molybdopterin/thiamine biosynthesis adenylyltransferase n=1 Tax=Kineosporia succinea TaxID=84632 RepID=A0ABT9P3V6_9ACTN|nr:hypothetical protein [Kineosporia succinea]MDP9827383.1 hypothetical protein [Kineosporia succinea]
MRIRLKPGLRRAWRDPATLQLGLSRRRGTVITGLTPQDRPLVEALRHGIDSIGTPERLGPPASGRTGRPALGHNDGAAPPARDSALLRLLDEAGVLAPTGFPPPGRPGQATARLSPDASVWSVVHPGCGDGWPLLAVRARCLVVVRGAGRIGTSLAATLAAAGVGTVLVQDAGRVGPEDLAPAGAGLPDLGRPRQAVGQDVVRRSGGHPAPRPPGRGPDLVVLVEHGAADAARADPLMSTDVPHLAVVVGEDGVVVGPLVRPGSSPCLRCLDLHRRDRDPAWPGVLSQVLQQVRDHGPMPEESAVAGLTAGLATLQVLAHLDGHGVPAAVGATLEVELPDGLIARRPWPVHPACGCPGPRGTSRVAGH